jgi:predicted PolB exonuclease-like 3'-5' exonuclease
MSKLFFDIETIPCDEKTREIYIAYKQKGMAEEIAQEVVEEMILKTSLDGTFGRICCIAYLKEDGLKTTKGVLKGDEKELLQQFWNVARDVHLFIGHNVFEFDFPFIFKRSIINGVKPRHELNFAKYRNQPIFDTMCEWSKWSYNSKTSLDTLAKIFGYPTSKDEMDGSQVWPAFQEGRIDDICTYCMKDVELTRKVYYRLMVEQMPDDQETTVTEDIPF